MAAFSFLSSNSSIHLFLQCKCECVTNNKGRMHSININYSIISPGLEENARCICMFVFIALSNTLYLWGRRMEDKQFLSGFLQQSGEGWRGWNIAGGAALTGTWSKNTPAVIRKWNQNKTLHRAGAVLGMLYFWLFSVFSVHPFCMIFGLVTQRLLPLVNVCTSV